MSEQTPLPESEKLEPVPSIAEIFFSSEGEDEQLVEQDQERRREEFNAFTGKDWDRYSGYGDLQWVQRAKQLSDIWSDGMLRLERDRYLN